MSLRPLQPYKYPPGYEHYGTRSIEILLIEVDLTLAILIYLYPFLGWNALNSESYSVLLRGMEAPGWAMLFLTKGLLHSFALYINGRARWTNWTRVVTNGFSALFWGCFCASLVRLGISGTMPGALLLCCSFWFMISRFKCVRGSALDARVASSA